MVELNALPLRVRFLRKFYSSSEWIGEVHLEVYLLIRSKIIGLNTCQHELWILDRMSLQTRYGPKQDHIQRKDRNQNSC